MNLQLGGLVKRTSKAARQDITTQAVTFESLVPSLPARLEEVGGSQERVITEDGSDQLEVRLSISANEVINLGGEVRKDTLVDGWAKLVCCEKTRCTVFLDDRHLVGDGGKWLPYCWKLHDWSLQGHEASGGCDSEWIKGRWCNRRIGVDVREELLSLRRRSLDTLGRGLVKERCHSEEGI